MPKKPLPRGAFLINLFSKSDLNTKSNKQELGKYNEFTDSLNIYMELGLLIRQKNV